LGYLKADDKQNYMPTNDSLFCTHSLPNLIRNLPHRIQEKIDRESREYILNVNEDEYIEHLVSEFSIESLKIDRDNIEIAEQYDANVESLDYGRSVSVARTFLTFAIPFIGDRMLFKYQSSTRNSMPPDGSLATAN
jgi:hypothetical protein